MLKLYYVLPPGYICRSISSWYTVYDRMDAAATINFSVQSGAATIRERRLFESGVYFVQSGYRINYNYTSTRIVY